MKTPKEITSSHQSRTFLLESEDMCLHIIKTGYTQRKNYLVIKEDAYQQYTGDTELMSVKEIREQYNIHITGI